METIFQLWLLIFVFHGPVKSIDGNWPARIVEPVRDNASTFDVSRYCRLCQDHTMCIYARDGKTDVSCRVEDVNDLEDPEILSVLSEHNAYRNLIASEGESRGNPGPQPTAKYMMELIWDDELARLANQWVTRCKPDRRDACRDVERFSVCQNVHTIGVREIKDNLAVNVMRRHIKAWYDEVARFDLAKVGRVDFADRNHSSYLPIADAGIERIGCASGVYSLRGEGSPRRTHSLVCNYGPCDRSSARQLYEIGQPGGCPGETLPSRIYESLCTRVFHGPAYERSARRNEKRRKHENRNVAFSITIAIYRDWLRSLLPLLAYLLT